MASFVYTRAKELLANGGLDLDSHDIRVALVMTNTTVDTEEDKLTISGFTTLDEMDGAAYVRKALANEVVNRDDVNNRAEFDADDVVWTALGNGARMIEGAVIYRHVTNDADSIPIAFVDLTNFNPGGNNLTLQWNAEGILQLA